MRCPARPGPAAGRPGAAPAPGGSAGIGSAGIGIGPGPGPEPAEWKSTVRAAAALRPRTEAGERSPRGAGACCALTVPKVPISSSLSAHCN